jgi:hypothetical protein
MDWGKKIAILYIGFVVLTLAFVFFAMTQKVDLVTDNYYEKELKYQEQIDKSKRTKELKEKTDIQILDKTVKIKYPNKPDKNSQKDFILFYRPSDPSKDLKIQVSADSLGIQVIPTEKFTKGFWKIKLSWTSGGNEYYDESIVNIP